MATPDAIWQRPRPAARLAGACTGAPEGLLHTRQTATFKAGHIAVAKLVMSLLPVVLPRSAQRLCLRGRQGLVPCPGWQLLPQPRPGLRTQVCEAARAHAATGTPSQACEAARAHAATGTPWQACEAACAHAATGTT